MAVKNVAPKTWGIVRSADLGRWSAYPAGDKPAVPDPSLGVYAQNVQRVGEGVNPITTPAVATQAAGSSLLIFTAFYQTQFGSLVHNKGGAISNVASLQYTAWAPYGGRMDWVPELVGGSGQTVSYSNTSLYETDEKSIFILEVRDGQTLFAQTPVQSPASAADTLQCIDITTTGPALLYCCIWGDSDVSNPLSLDVHADSLAAGWQQPGEIALPAQAHIQGALAVRVVSAAGTYPGCKFSLTPAQRALVFQGRVET